jgi:hypothetical protein
MCGGKMKSLDRRLLIVLVQVHHGGTEPRRNPAIRRTYRRHQCAESTERPSPGLGVSMVKFGLQPFHYLFKRLSPMLIVLKLVEAGAGGGQEDNVAGLSCFCGAFHGHI